MPSSANTGQSATRSWPSPLRASPARRSRSGSARPAGSRGAARRTEPVGQCTRARPKVGRTVGAALSVELVEVVRSGFRECVHRGSVVVVGADGEVLAEFGEVDTPIYPRS